MSLSSTYTRDYTDNRFKEIDAVQDIIEYFGVTIYNRISPLISVIVDQEQFAHYCALAGIRGYPVKAWYEHYHGEGTWAWCPDRTNWC